jgi:hypothetical protein
MRFFKAHMETLKAFAATDEITNNDGKQAQK